MDERPAETAPEQPIVPPPEPEIEDWLDHLPPYRGSEADLFDAMAEAHAAAWVVCR